MAPRTHLAWLLAAGALILVALGGAGGLRAYHLGTRPPFLDPDFLVQPSRPPAVDHKTLLVAGTGSCLHVIYPLLESFGKSSAGRGITVKYTTGIGSEGGIQAAVEGAVSLGMVARPLTGNERNQLPVVIPFARVAVVVVASGDVPLRGLTSAELLDLYRGARPRWSTGATVQVLQREPGDPDHLAVGRALPGFSAINQEAYRRQRWRVLPRGASTWQQLRWGSGAVGLADMEGQDGQVKVLPVDGAVPSPVRLVRGEYPFYKDLALVAPGPLTGPAAGFVRFIFSDAGQSAIRSKGLVPLPRMKR